MPKLLKRKKEKESNGPTCIFCRCNELVPSKRYKGFYWCPKCKEWCYPKWHQNHKPIIADDSDEKLTHGSLLELRRTMERFEERFKPEFERKTVKVYTAEDFDQEFLKSLVGKKQ